MAIPERDEQMGRAQLTRVVVVDDSPSMRLLLEKMINAEPDMRVVGSAPDPFEARELIKQLQPDVVTLDIEMPGMDGIETVTKIRESFPKVRVIMCSTLTERGADTTRPASASPPRAAVPQADCVRGRTPLPRRRPASAGRSWRQRHAHRARRRRDRGGPSAVIPGRRGTRMERAVLAKHADSSTPASSTAACRHRSASTGNRWPPLQGTSRDRRAWLSPSARSSAAS